MRDHPGGCANDGGGRGPETDKKEIHIPLVADIHFDYRLAVAAIETEWIRSVSIRKYRKQGNA